VWKFCERLEPFYLFKSEIGGKKGECENLMNPTKINNKKRFFFVNFVYFKSID